MNDLDLERDDALIARIRDTLNAVAATTPAEGEATVTPLGRGERRPRLLFAAAAAVLAVLVAAAVLVSGRDADTTVAVPIPDGPFSALPNGFDPARATPIFSTDGEAEEVAQAYLEARFWDFPQPGVTVSVTERSDTAAKARWRSGDDTGTLAEGDVLMRRNGERWVVIASTTDSIDVGSIAFDGTRVAGTVRSRSEDSMFADVLDWKGDPVHQAPQPRGAAGAASLMGTAGGPATGSLQIDVKHPGAPAVVRVMLVGGTVLGVTEFRLDPPPLPAHEDFEGCLVANNTREKEPTPDIVARNCAAALEGEVIASGVAIDRGWELVSSDETGGRFVTLRFRDQVGMFRMRTDEPAPDVLTDPVERVEACCAATQATVVVAVVRNDVSRVRMTTSAGITVEAETFVDVDRRYAVLVAEPTVEGEEASLEVLLPDGEWVSSGESFSLAVLGG